MILASVRGDLGGYVSTVFFVYSLILIAYLLTNLYLGFGGRMPYNRVAGGILGFLRDVSEPYLRFFRRLIPPFGAVDLSPMLALFVLLIGGRLLGSLIAG